MAGLVGVEAGRGVGPVNQIGAGFHEDVRAFRVGRNEDGFVGRETFGDDFDCDEGGRVWSGRIGKPEGESGGTSNQRLWRDGIDAGAYRKVCVRVRTEREEST